MIRGSLAQALAIGCMRVYMMPSCSSVVTWLSRRSGTVNSELPQQLIAGQCQLGNQGHQVFEQIDSSFEIAGHLAQGILPLALGLDACALLFGLAFGGLLTFGFLSFVAATLLGAAFIFVALAPGAAPKL